VAEILIQRKRRRSVWPWLLGLLVMALLPLPFLGNGDDAPRAGSRAATRDARADTTAVRDTSASPAAGLTGAVAAGGEGGAGTVPQSAGRTTALAAGAVAPNRPPAAPPTASATGGTPFERFIAARDPNPNDSEQREYTAGALRHLADELRALGASASGIRSIRAYADSLRMPRVRGSAHPDYARAAFLAAAREFDLLRARRRAAVDTARLRSTAWAIRPDQRLAAQRGTVQRFFEAARDALHSLSTKRS
jgi:hypothetical protein